VKEGGEGRKEGTSDPLVRFKFKGRKKKKEGNDGERNDGMLQAGR
jgi:hypothetical protein